MKVGDRVFKTDSETGEMINGVIESICTVSVEGVEIFIVSWDKGFKTKEFESGLTLLIEDTPDPEVVIITKTEFNDIMMKVLNGNNFPDMDAFTLEVVQIAGLGICKRLEREIFGESRNA